jgi:hypothetical protein
VASHDPALGQNGAAFDLIGAPDDLGFEVGQDSRLSLLEFRPLVAGVGEQPLQERMHPEQGGEKQDAAVAILDSFVR